LFRYDTGIVLFGAHAGVVAIAISTCGEMIQKFETNTPPFIFLDSEYDSTREPNGNSKSTGVTLLDEYVRNKYQRSETFGELFYLAADTHSITDS
jgi:hypothetical protein